jgi:murein DD-endopeptidase MepM/ murein hydrolase activator NlpD
MIDATVKLQSKNLDIDSSLFTRHSLLNGDPKAIAKQVETVFLNEFLKIMMEKTSFGKDRTVSTYMPYITYETAKSLADRGIGIGDFFLRTPFYDSNEPITPPFNPPVTNWEEWGGNSEVKLRFPAEGKITSRYGLRYDPIDGRLKHHNGVDIAMPEGSPIRSVAAGRVVFSGFSSGYGKTVIVEHENGLTSLYAHNSINLVKVGDVVDERKVIALSGSTGRSTGPHLHFELRKNGVPVDPAGMIG